MQIPFIMIYIFIKIDIYLSQFNSRKCFIKINKMAEFTYFYEEN